MPQYTSEQNVRSGVPLGGLGAGKLEIMPCGLLDRFTFLNNAQQPMASADSKGIPGFHFGLFVKDRQKKHAKLLQAEPMPDREAVSGIRYEGAYPFAYLTYEDADLPVRCQLEAWSPLVPGDEKNSGVPSAFFRFKVTNLTAHPVRVALAGVARNIIGAWCVGRFNQIVETPAGLHACFYNKKTQSQDPAAGEMVLSVVKNSRWEFSYLGEWNMQARPFAFDKTSVNLNEAWTALSHDGVLPNTSTEKVVASESCELGAAISAATDLKGKTHATVTFVLSWHFPNHGEGRMYEAWWRTALDVAGFSVDKQAELYEKTRDWVRRLESLKIDAWLKDALLNNLYPLVSGSLWTKKGRFGFFEASQACPLLGTLDVHFYGSLPLAYLFPALETRYMIQFAEVQRAQGYVPHDLGRGRSDLPSNSTNGLFWKDLNAKFILLCYRDFLLTKDETFLKKVYPFVKKAFYWLASTDKNKDFLPDHEGADQTFDLWAFYGASAYAGGLFLASLLALEKIAGLLQDEPMQKEARQWFKKAQTSFEEKLWHKKYYLAYNNAKEHLSEKQLNHHVKSQKVSVACMAAQLTGQWVANLLGLGYIVSPERIKKALAMMLEFNAQASSFGAANGVLPTGEIDRSNAQSQNCWYGVTYTLAALAYDEGFQKEALALAKKAWDNASMNTLDPWNQPDTYSSLDGRRVFGDHYMRNMVIWSLLSSIARKDKSVAAFLEALS